MKLNKILKIHFLKRKRIEINFLLLVLLLFFRNLPMFSTSIGKLYRVSEFCFNVGKFVIKTKKKLFVWAKAIEDCKKKKFQECFLNNFINGMCKKSPWSNR